MILRSWMEVSGVVVKDSFVAEQLYDSGKGTLGNCWSVLIFCSRHHHYDFQETLQCLASASRFALSRLSWSSFRLSHLPLRRQTSIPLIFAPTQSSHRHPPFPPSTCSPSFKHHIHLFPRLKLPPEHVAYTICREKHLQHSTPLALFQTFEKDTQEFPGPFVTFA